MGLPQSKKKHQARRKRILVTKIHEESMPKYNPPTTPAPKYRSPTSPIPIPKSSTNENFPVYMTPDDEPEECASFCKLID